MSAPPEDTDPAVEHLIISGLRQMTGAQRLERMVALNELVCALAMADIRRRHPQATESELLVRLASRRIDPDILRRLCGWDVAREGY